MEFLINDVVINYVNYGNKKGQDVIILHGWGQNIEMMKPVGDGLSNDYNIYLIDLPGFGKSTEPKYAWRLIDYVEALHEFVLKLGIKNPVFIGHSVGGEISLLYASIYETNKIVALSSPFRPIIKKLSLKTKILKTAKKIPILNKLEDFAKKHTGSTEYRSATPIMREILVNFVNTDLSDEARKIKAPTLLIWGSNDQTVPLADAYDLEKLIKDAGVVVFEGCTHYAYLERLSQTLKVINSFIGG